MKDVTAATITSKETVPGYDNITVRLPNSRWSTIRAHIKDHFQACLSLEYYPSAFKVAEIVLLPKIERDLSSLKRWRPNSLLSSLGKGRD